MTDLNNEESEVIKNNEESEVIKNDDGTYERWYDCGFHELLGAP